MPVHVTNETPGSTRQTVTINAHTLQTDSTAGATAPDPHDLFDAALASCKAITVTMYAKTKGMKLDRVVVDIERDNSKEREGVYVLKATLSFEGDLTDAERQRLQEVAGKCPVHKLMTKVDVQIV